MASTTQDKEVEPPSNDLDAEPSAVTGLQVVCLSPQPWLADLPTNRQQVMTRVAGSGNRVLFVDTGVFVGRHARELLRSRARLSLVRQVLFTEEWHRRVRAMKAPALLPWGHRFRFAARVNAALTAWRVRRHVRRRAEPVVLWLYDPCFAMCIGRSAERFAVYDCVDDYAEQVGPDIRKRRLVADLDVSRPQRARLVFATSRGLVERHREHNERTHLVGNVGDFAHFAPAADRSYAAPTVASSGRPTIGFAGNFLSNKVDLPLLRDLASRRPDWTFMLVGPTHARHASGGRADRDAGERGMARRGSLRPAPTVCGGVRRGDDPVSAQCIYA